VDDRLIARHKVFMDLAIRFADLSCCLSRKVGAVLVKDWHVLSTAYNGAPSGFKHCSDIGCRRKGAAPGTRLNECYAVHTEINILTDLAKRCISPEGGTLYITTYTCNWCAKAMISAGIKTIIYLNDYPDDFAKELLNTAKIEVIKYSDLIGGLNEPDLNSGK